MKDIRIPTVEHGNKNDVIHITPQTSGIVRFKATFPVSDIKDRMLAPLYADLIQRGTASHSRKEFAAAVEALGARLDVTSDRVGITIDGCALAGTFPRLLDLVKEMLERPAFNKKEMDQVHKQYAQYLHDEADNARTQAYLGFTQALFAKNHPYYRPSADTRRTFLRSVTRKSYLDFHKKLFAVHGIVSTSGTEAHRQSTAKLFSTFGKTKDTTLLAPASAAPHATETTYRTVHDKANIELYIGNVLPLTLSDSSFLPFNFGLQVLGKWGGFSGRLMSTVREKEGLTYTIYARTEGITKDRLGMWYIFTFFTPKDLDKGLASTKREIARIAQKGVTPKELTTFKELLKNQFILAHESDAKTLALYHDALCAGMTPAEVAAQYDAMQTLTQKEVNAALRQHLDPTRLVISGAGPINPNRKTLSK
ncbi:insulinase family protein [Candidatus Kaiserbacteria bacterium]|nr:insulinase family protein [Candidatus Kaiserbacteria bacterium]